MSTSKENSLPGALGVTSTVVSEATRDADRLAAEQMAVEVVEGLRKLAAEKAARKSPNQG